MNKKVLFYFIVFFSFSFLRSAESEEAQLARILEESKRNYEFEQEIQRALELSKQDGAVMHFGLMQETEEEKGVCQKKESLAEVWKKELTQIKGASSQDTILAMQLAYDMTPAQIKNQIIGPPDQVTLSTVSGEKTHFIGKQAGLLKQLYVPAQETALCGFFSVYNLQKLQEVFNEHSTGKKLGQPRPSELDQFEIQALCQKAGLKNFSVVDGNLYNLLGGPQLNPLVLAHEIKKVPVYFKPVVVNMQSAGCEGGGHWMAFAIAKDSTGQRQYIIMESLDNVNRMEGQQELIAKNIVQLVKNIEKNL